MKNRCIPGFRPTSNPSVETRTVGTLPIGSPGRVRMARKGLAMRLRRIVGVVGAVVLSVGGLAVLPTFLTPAVASPSSGPLFSWGGNIDGELGIGENTGPQTSATTLVAPAAKRRCRYPSPPG